MARQKDGKWRGSVRQAEAVMIEALESRRLLDAGDTLVTELVETCNTPGQASGVVVVGSYAYVADGTEGLQIIDISNSSAPILVGSYSMPGGEARRVAVSGHYAYVADAGSLQIINVSNPAAPTLAASFATVGFAVGVDVAGGYVYVSRTGNPNQGVDIIDVSVPSSPVRVGSYPSVDGAFGVAVDGAYAYVANHSWGLQINDISTPSSPVLMGRYNTPGYSYDVSVAGRYAYVADQDSVQIIDVVNPAAPSLAAAYALPGVVQGIAVSGSFAYVADGAGGLKIVNIADPTAPFAAGSYDTPGEAGDVAVVGSYVYVADGANGLQIIRTSVPLLSGYVEYVDVDGTSKPAQYIKVEAWEKQVVPLPFLDWDYKLAEGFTDDKGKFVFTHDTLGNILRNVDTGLLEGGTRDIYYKYSAENDVCWVSPEIGEVYHGQTDVSDNIPGPTYTPITIATPNAEAFGLPGFLKDAKDWLDADTSWARPQVGVLYPGVTVTGGPEFFSLSGLITIPGAWFADADVSMRAHALFHEYGHAVQFSTRALVPGVGGSLPDGWGPWPHGSSSVSSEGFALKEGWADFFWHAVSVSRGEGDAAYESQLESNNWWTGTGACGNVVEGAVTSIFWRIYHDVPGGWDNLWSVFYNDKPDSIWNASGTKDFYHQWVARFGGSRAVHEIFIDNGIPVWDDDYEPNNTSTTAYTLANTEATYSGLILADAVDFYKFTLSGPVSPDAFVSLDVANGRGNLRITVYGDSGILGPSSWTDSAEHSVVVSMAGQPAGTYFVKVDGFQGDFSPDYALALSIPISRGPGATVETPSGIQRGDVTINYVLQDADSHPLSIQVWYCLDDSGPIFIWSPATAAGGDGTTNLTSSPTGRSHAFVWDSIRDIGNAIHSNVKVRIIPSDIEQGVPDTTEGFMIGFDIPELESVPGASATLYLNFTGDVSRHWIRGPLDSVIVPETPAYDEDGNAVLFSPMELTNMGKVWAWVAEKYSPFNINVSTIDPGNLSDGQTEMVVIGGSWQDWLGSEASGVSPIGGFYDSVLSNVSYVFSQYLIPDGPHDIEACNAAIGETIAHEAGHGFGLVHENATGTGLTDQEKEYYGGDGARVPIMGANLDTTHRGLWWLTNQEPNQRSNQTVQDELSVLNNDSNDFHYRADDHGNDAATATLMNWDGRSWTYDASRPIDDVTISGVIEQTNDQDWFSFTTGAGTVTFGVDVPPYGAMLDATIELRDNNGNPIPGVQSVKSGQGASVTATLPSGSYRVVVGSNGAYGDVGQYYLSGDVTNRTPTDIALTTASVAENQPSDTAVGTLSTIDPDTGDTFTYTLVSGTGSTDNSSFSISSGTLQTTAMFNYEAKSSYSIRVRTTDAGGLTFEKAFTITVLNAAEVVPTITSITTDTGIGSSDGVTSDPTLLINGTSEPGMTITVYRGGVLAGTTSANGSGNWTYDYTGTSLADGNYSFTATAGDGLGNTTAASAPYAVKVDTAAPTLTAVYVRGSAWAASFLSFLATNSLGSSTYGFAIPVGSGSTQLQTLPWRNLNQISIRFSEDVSVAQAQFAIAGSVGSYSVSNFSYSSTDHVATWSLSAAIGPDKLYVAVPGSGTTPVTDAAGNILDGEWTNPTSYSQVGSTSSFPSGNGTAGGNFAFRFDVLPGDSTGGSLGKVNVADVAQTKSRSGLAETASSCRSDFDGNGLINVADVGYVKSRSGLNSLPTNAPVLPVFS